jgi:Flp pilus assembly protein TadD
MIRGLVRLLLIAIVVGGAVTGGVMVWRNSRPRDITVAIYSDFTFRQRPNWRETLRARFDAVTKLYDEAAHVRWKVLTNDAADPTVLLRSLDGRRTALSDRGTHPADVLVLYTALPDGARTASANPFSHSIVLVDQPNDPEPKNVRLLAHELAHLFGAPHEDKTAGNLMSEPPKSDQFPERTVKLIRAMRGYNFAAGTAALTGSEKDRAVSALTKAMAGLFPNPAAQAHEQIAVALQADGRVAAAIPDFREAARLDPKNAAFHMALAAILAQDLWTEESLQELREAVKLEPNNTRYRVTLSAYLAKNGDTDGAAEELQAAIRLAPNDATLHSALGSILAVQAGLVNSAIASYETALKLNPQLTAARQNLAKVISYKDKAQADAVTARARIQQSPSDAAAHLALGSAQWRMGDLPAATKEITRALELNPTLGQAHSALGEIDYLQRDYAGAWQEVKKARLAGAEPPQSFVQALKRKMPE